MNLIGRYIFREALTSTAIVLAVLLLIFMTNQFAETLGEAAADSLPRTAVLTVFGLQLVQFIALLAPVGLMLGILLALARLNRDSEMTAINACGIGPVRLLRPIGALAVVLALVVGWLALFEAPAASREIEAIRFDAQAELELGALTPGRFTAVDGGTTVVYAADADEDVLRDVFIEREVEGRIIAVVAERGERVLNPETGEWLLRLRNGKRYVGTPGEARFAVDEFVEHGIPIRLEATVFDEGLEARSTASLLRATDPESRAELAWRISAPLSILALTLLAVPLGRASPREGKYARFGVGLLIYIIYANTLSIGRVWIEREAVPQWLGLWWVHAVLVLVAVVMLISQSGLGAGGLVEARERIEPTG
ncbi:MAG TPA: LPS export ABC transporter permease LptF [Gammaproteobacteria bacterium]